MHASFGYWDYLFQFEDNSWNFQDELFFHHLPPHFLSSLFMSLLHDKDLFSFAYTFLRLFSVSSFFLLESQIEIFSSKLSCFRFKMSCWTAWRRNRMGGEGILSYSADFFRVMWAAKGVIWILKFTFDSWISLSMEENDALMAISKPVTELIINFLLFFYLVCLFLIWAWNWNSEVIGHS